ncbi:hypothetical protein NQ317_006744 [Molorchus minor]|uniref:Transposable element P transposase-like RNase H C-terminal domain-containing protein n=1 Tax=Molorchus minor TaxID=1323400 RepID=A0ABQ9IU09_9CUCU|nr:hypothetical protein NQ317_006744 [Molorchus minor]
MEVGEIEQRSLATATFVKQIDELFDSFNGSRTLPPDRSLLNSKLPSQVGWLTTINAIRKIWAYLHSQGINSLRPRSLNQDALENLFGAVRGGCGRSDNPTAVQFSGSLKTQILNGLTRQKIIGSNCEEDDTELLSNLIQFLTVENVQQQEAVTIKRHTEKPTLHPNVADAIAKAVNEGETSTLSVAYVSGFIAKKI